MITAYETFAPLLMGCGSSLQTGLKLMEMGCTKAFVVYDAGMKAVGISDKIVQNIQGVGIETVEFSGVLPDPPDKMVEEAAALAREAGIDAIVAVGGGSAMDTAKAINVLMNNEPPITQYLGLVPGLKPGVKLICIPTTSGTGSETTCMAVLTIVDQNKKDSVFNPITVATLAILDPELTLGLPPSLTAATGVDAFAHAVEALTGSMANPLSDLLAREAIRYIATWLPVAVNDGSNIEAREHLMLASTYSGMAFTNALVHWGHSLGHSIGALFHVPHGIACSFALPEVIEKAARAEWVKVLQICECMGISVPEGASPEEIGAIARVGIRAFLDEVGMPRLSASDITEDDLPRIAKQASEDGSFPFAPYRVGQAELIGMLTHAYEAA